MGTRARILVVGAAALLLTVAHELEAKVPQVGGPLGLPQYAEDVNLVANPSFEERDGDAVVGWKGGPASHFFPTAEVAHTDRHSMQLRESNTFKYYAAMSQTVRLEPGWYTIRAWIKADGVTGTAGGRVSMKVGRGTLSTRVVGGTRDWSQVSATTLIDTPTDAVLRIEGFRKPTGNVYFDDIEVRRQVPPGVEVFLLYPNYRGLLFDDRPQGIRAAIAVNADVLGTRLPDLKVRVALVPPGETAAAVAEEFRPSDARFVATLDAARVVPGAYDLEVRAINQDGRVVFERRAYRVVKLPGAARRDFDVHIDADNTLVLDGKRRFVLGIYDTGGFGGSPETYVPKAKALADAHLNMYINYHYGGAPVTALSALMNAFQRYGIWYLHTVNAWYPEHPYFKRVPSCGGRDPESVGAPQFTECMAKTLAPIDGFAGWYTADEAPISRAAPVFGQYEVLRRGSPAGITFIAQNAPRALPRWRDAADVIGVDAYPIFNIPEGQVSPLPMVTQWVDIAQSSVERSRPVWAVIQYFQFGGKGHWPTYEELRSMSFMGIVGGARGLFYWSYGAKALQWVKDEKRRAELWSRLVKVTTEIKALEPVLLSPDAPEILKSAPAASEIRVLAKRAPGGRHVIAVNMTPQAVTGRFALADAASAVEVVHDRRRIPLEATTTFTETFEPYGVRVFRIVETP